MRCRKCKEREAATASALQQIIEEILRRNDIEDFFHGNKSCTIKILPPTQAPLVIRKLGDRVVVLEDDTSELIPSTREPTGPHAEFEILEGGRWDIAFLREKHQRKGKRAIEYIDDCRTVRPVRQRRQEKSAAEWGNRLAVRGYSSGTLRYARKV